MTTITDLAGIVDGVKRGEVVITSVKMEVMRRRLMVLAVFFLSDGSEWLVFYPGGIKPVQYEINRTRLICSGVKNDASFTMALL